MPKWHNAGLDEAQSDKIRTLLQQRLTALIDTNLTLKHIHWNVVGPGFIGVHEMLDEHVASVREMSDELAERIATLGGVPIGTPGYVASTRSWSEYDLGRAEFTAHLTALDSVYDGVIADHRKVIEEVGEIDPITEDILIGQATTLEQYQWFVRAFLTDAEGTLPN